jgi:3'-5' exonuclease
MLNAKDIHKLVFLDIETTPLWDNYSDMPAKFKKLFVQQNQWKIDEVAYRDYIDTKKKEGDLQLCYNRAYEEVYKERAHLSPEFSQIICISAGMIMEGFQFKAVSFTGENDRETLLRFLENKKSFIHQKEGANSEKYICCHNGKQFDLPFISKRIMYHGLELPAMLDIGGYKPWDLTFVVDTKEQLKFGGMDAPSLETLCTMLNVETATDKHGEPEILREKQKAKDFKFISDYCEHDILALAQCYLKLHRSPQHPNGITNQLTKV